MHEDIGVDVIVFFEFGPIELAPQDATRIEIMDMAHQGAIEQIVLGMGREMIDRRGEEIRIPDIVRIEIGDEGSRTQPQAFVAGRLAAADPFRLGQGNESRRTRPPLGRSCAAAGQGGRSAAARLIRAMTEQDAAAHA